MNRRTLIGSFAALALPLSGCVGDTADQEAPTASPSESGAASPTPAHVSGVEVPPCPDRPAELTRNRARRFTVRFERAYASRLAVPEDADDVTAVTVRVEADAVEETDEGWLVHLRAFPPTYTTRSPTPSPHGDPGFHYVSYHVAAETLFRARGGDERVDPRTNGEESPGEPVSCPP